MVTYSPERRLRYQQCYVVVVVPVGVGGSIRPAVLDTGGHPMRARQPNCLGLTTLGPADITTSGLLHHSLTTSVHPLSSTHKSPFSRSLGAVDFPPLFQAKNNTRLQRPRYGTPLHHSGISPFRSTARFLHWWGGERLDLIARILTEEASSQVYQINPRSTDSTTGLLEAVTCTGYPIDKLQTVHFSSLPL